MKSYGRLIGGMKGKWRVLPSELDRSLACQGPIDKDPSGRVPLRMLSSAELATCLHPLALIGVDLTAPSRLFVV
jgi:hypothetical protein